MNAPEEGSARLKWVKIIASYLVSLLLVGVGVYALLYLIRTKPEPSGAIEEAPGRLVRIFDARKVDHQIAMKAYGVSQAGEVWRATAEVSGKVVFLDEGFEAGDFVKGGTIVARIDPHDFQLAVDRYGEEVQTRKLELKELEQKQKNLAPLVKLAERQLELSERDLADQKTLVAKNAAPQDTVDRAEMDVISRTNALQDLRNQEALIPIQAERLKASIKLAEVSLRQAQRDLGKTEIKLAFDARCAKRNVSASEFVAAGTSLGSFFSVDKAEVVVQVEPRKIGMLLPVGSPLRQPIDATDPESMRHLLEQHTLKVTVTSTLGAKRFQWQGKVVRFNSAFNPKSRTIPLVVEVPDPYKGVIPGQKPPLIPDLFCEVTLHGGKVKAVVVPREVLREGYVHLLRDGQLAIAKVDIMALEEQRAVIASGIRDGDQIIMTDLFPAYEGMKLRGHVVPNPALGEPEGAKPKGKAVKGTQTAAEERP